MTPRIHQLMIKCEMNLMEKVEFAEGQKDFFELIREVLREIDRKVAKIDRFRKAQRNVI